MKKPERLECEDSCCGHWPSDEGSLYDAYEVNLYIQEQQQRIEELVEARDRLIKRTGELTGKRNTDLLRIKELESKLATAEKWDDIESSENERLRKENKRLDAALEHIGEYWNRDENEKAMSDALWHIIDEVQKARVGE